MGALALTGGEWCCTVHDFDSYLNTRNGSIPPLGAVMQGPTAIEGHFLLSSMAYSDPASCISFMSERWIVGTLVPAVKSCHDKEYHHNDACLGPWHVRKLGVQMSSDDTHGIGIDGWHLSIVSIVVTYLYCDSSVVGQNNYEVRHHTNPILMQHVKASSTQTLLMGMGFIQHVVKTLAEMPEDHRSGMGKLLAKHENCLLVASGAADNAMEIANQFNAPNTSTRKNCPAFLSAMTRPGDAECETVFMACWFHLNQAVERRAWNAAEGAGKDGKKNNRDMFMQAVRCTYHSFNKLERDSICDLILLVAECTDNTLNGEWFQGQYMTDPHFMWFYSASGMDMPGAMPNNCAKERFMRTAKEELMAHKKVNTMCLLNETFPRLTMLICGVGNRIGPPARMNDFLSPTELMRAELRLSAMDHIPDSDPIVQSLCDRHFFVNSNHHRTKVITEGRIIAFLDQVCVRVDGYDGGTGAAAKEILDLRANLNAAKQGPNDDEALAGCIRATLSKAKGAMDAVWRGRSLHMIKQHVDTGLIDKSNWWLSFSCSCIRWHEKGYCEDLEMLGEWWGDDWVTVQGNCDVLLQGAKPPKKGRKAKKQQSALEREAAAKSEAAKEAAAKAADSQSDLREPPGTPPSAAGQEVGIGGDEHDKEFGGLSIPKMRALLGGMGIASKAKDKKEFLRQLLASQPFHNYFKPVFRLATPTLVHDGVSQLVDICSDTRCQHTPCTTACMPPQ